MAGLPQIFPVFCYLWGVCKRRCDLRWKFNNFTRGVLMPLALAFSAGSYAAEMPGKIECTLLVDQQTGKTLLRQGACGERLSPMSTFKVPLALIGYDSGILTGAHTPTWDYKPAFKGEKRTRKPVDPKIWQADSIVWFSQELTRRLGQRKFADYVARFDYGNRDVVGLKGGEDGLTHAWLMSSLKISADEQASFLRRLLGRKLPVSDKAYDATLKIIPVFDAGDGWTVHGKTGSGRLRDTPGKNARLGWFVGWAEKDGRTVVFARMRIAARKGAEAPGLALRAEFLNTLPELMREMK
jgi:beta-lactamase class D